MQKEENSANKRVLSIEDQAALWTAYDMMQEIGSVVDWIAEEGGQPVGATPEAFVNSYWAIDSLIDILEERRKEYADDPTEGRWKEFLDAIYKADQEVYVLAGDLGLRNEYRRYFKQEEISARMEASEYELEQRMEDNGGDNDSEGA